MDAEREPAPAPGPRLYASPIVLAELKRRLDEDGARSGEGGLSVTLRPVADDTEGP